MAKPDTKDSRNRGGDLSRIVLPIKTFLIFMTVGFFVFCLLMYLRFSPRFSEDLYNRALFFPIKASEYQIDSVSETPVKNVFFASKNGARLHAWYLKAGNERAVALFSHGNAGNLSHRVQLYEILLKEGLSVFAYDYEGYGLSEGSPSIPKLCEDGLAAYGYLTGELHYKPEQIILCGESLGGGVTNYIAERRPERAIILQSTFSSLPSVARIHMPLARAFPDLLFPENHFDNLLLVRKQHAPLLILHGTSDDTIPVSEAELLYKNSRKPTTFVRFENGSHNNLYTDFASLYEKSLHDFLEKQVFVRKNSL